ncbi:MAG: translation elongation factor Ts [Anaerolineales bacterium]|nr:translation elongation factor Ts [Anaerolineales bacterium]
MAITLDQIKSLREETGAGVLDCRKALEQAKGDVTLAIDYLREKGLSTAAKRADRETNQGVVEVYSHGNRVGVMVEVNCETDFVARSENFRNLAHEFALHIAASEPKYVSEKDIPESVLNEEREIARKRALEEGKSDEIVERIIEGRLNKLKDEICLMRQPYVRDDTITMEKLLMQNVAAIGENIVVRRFVRWELGEEIEQ